MLWINVRARTVGKTIALGMPMSTPVTAPGRGPGRGHSMPQDVRLSANGKIFYIADMAKTGYGSSTPITST